MPICTEIEFVFVHSYSSSAGNWAQVMMAEGESQGRVTRAVEIAKNLQVPVVANDSLDAVNAELYDKLGIENLGTARNTQDEVSSALERRTEGDILFVTSPDHLPRVVRDVLAQGATGSVFVASDVAFSNPGVEGVMVSEPSHEKGPFAGRIPANINLKSSE